MTPEQFRAIVEMVREIARAEVAPGFRNRPIYGLTSAETIADEAISHASELLVTEPKP